MYQEMQEGQEQQIDSVGQTRDYSEHRLAICFLHLAPAYQFYSSPKQWGYWGPSVQRLGAFGIVKCVKTAAFCSQVSQL